MAVQTTTSSGDTAQDDTTNQTDMTDTSQANQSTGNSTSTTSSNETRSALHKRPTKRRKRPEALSPPSTTPSTDPSSSTTTTAASTTTTTSLRSSKPIFKLGATLNRIKQQQQQQGLEEPSSSSSTTESKNEMTSTQAVKPTTSQSSPATSQSSQAIAIPAPANGIVSIGSLGGDDEDNRVIGYVEPCAHPTVVQGLCVVCGQTAQGSLPTTSSSGIYHASTTLHPHEKTKSNNMSQMTVLGGITLSVSETEGKRIAEQDAVRLRQQRKLSLVLDLDHTLVHATNDPRAQQHLGRPDVRTLLLPILLEDTNTTKRRQVFLQHYIKLRPHVKEFLQEAHQLYEIGVYTAGTREYAEQITILLARHLVGATHDQAELEQLHHRVAHVQAAYERQQQQRHRTPQEQQQQQQQQQQEEEATNGQPDNINKTNDSTENDGNDKAPEANGVASNETDDSKVSGKKRKRVTFGEPPSSQRSDGITLQDVEQLQRELQRAQRLESQALEMRQRVFGSRVVSRTDVGDLGRDVKSLKRIFPCGGTMAAVVDDREDVWANAKEGHHSRRGEPPENLLLVRPYHWDTFTGFADVNNAAGVDLSVRGQQEATGTSELDQQLLWTVDILKRLHKRYYHHSGKDRPNVPELLSDMRKEVLNGCNVVLSGLVPLHKQNATPNASTPRPLVVRYVESLGATVLPNVTKTTTHVVGAKDGTDKILAARRIPGCMIVRPSWLMECVWTISRRDEMQHLLGAPPKAGSSSVATTTSGSAQPLSASQRENSSSSGSSDEDDDFAAEFEKELSEEDSSQ